MAQITDLDAGGKLAHLAEVLPPLPDNGKPTARLHFGSLAEIVEYLPKTRAEAGAARQFFDRDDKEFFGCSMVEALEMARTGWQGGAERVQPLLDRVKTERPQTRKIARYDVAGAVAVVPRYLAGNPMSMKRIDTAPSNKSPIITLVACFSAPWNISTKVFEAYATAAAAITDRLEDAGFRVEIIAGRRESNDGTGTIEANGANNVLGYRSEVFFKAKAADESLNLSRLAFSMGHPGAFRRLLFAFGELHPAYQKSLSGMQGCAIALDAVEDRPMGTHVLPALAHLHKISKDGDPVKIFDEIVAKLKAQGCPGLE